MIYLNMYVCYKGDKLWWLQWACIFAVTETNQTHAVYTHCCILAVPMTNTRSPQTTLSYRGRKGEFHERATSGKMTRRLLLHTELVEDRKQLIKSIDIFRKLKLG